MGSLGITKNSMLRLGSAENKAHDSVPPFIYLFFPTQKFRSKEQPLPQDIIKASASHPQVFIQKLLPICSASK